ncbi:MAG: response regulator [Deltaproteobacteria bacterium]|nr:response regulator [Deltaproteobacteria bacterium]
MQTKKKILLFDEQKNLSGLFRASLEPKGFLIEETNCCMEASTHIVKNDYELLFIDLTLPDMKGFDLFQWLLGSSKHLTERVVFITSKPDQALDTKLKKIGRPYLSKPFSIKELSKAVSDVTN